MILPGIIIFLMYSLMGSVINGAVEKQTSYTKFTVQIVNCPDELSDFFTKNDYEVIEITNADGSTLTKDEFLDKIKNKEADMYVVYPENFMELAKAHKDDDTKPTPNVEIYFNSSLASIDCRN